MTIRTTRKGKHIIDLALLNQFNAQGCPACGHKFNLGDPGVEACGAGEGGPRLIHEHEAVFDVATASYVEKRCFAAKRGRTG